MSITPQRFRKKPVDVEAMQYANMPVDAPGMDDLLNGLAEWCKGRRVGPYGCNILIQTLEGNMLAFPGDWIIKGVKGEFYPCKPGIFAATYDAVT